MFSLLALKLKTNRVCREAWPSVHKQPIGQMEWYPTSFHPSSVRRLFIVDSVASKRSHLYLASRESNMIVATLEILQSMIAVNRVRCVQFRPRVATDTQFIWVTSEQGCWSYVSGSSVDCSV
jgi:hypothetical protein